mmetsp:Transcript_8136/g.15743  ORF Transcript_8136/g.15743 Transcript_8136/m.15743 type:complete len:248 (-) Transcript_8136:57-800(-)|eukprot:scaffold8374_cov175-Amphora_coffeaeformis.AAC.84
MKIALSILAACSLASTNAFVPKATPFQPSRLAAGDIEKEIEDMVDKEMGKTAKLGKLRNEQSGMEYAPWLKVSEKDEVNMRQIMKEKAIARAKREQQEKEVSGSLLMDSQAQELSGTGLRGELVDGNCVELVWATATEKFTEGFLIKRRPAKTSEFEVIASYENYGPLASKGGEGSVYRYLDENLPPGGWVYRITECDKSGAKNDLSQCLIEIQTDEEQAATKFAAIGFAAFAIFALVAGSLLDPYQ